MKFVKTLGIAVIAAIALIALVGVGSASATVLCKKNINPCGDEYYGVGTEIHAVLNEGGAQSNVYGIWTVVECGLSTITGKITNKGGVNEAVTANVESLTFGECRCAEGAVGSGHATTLEKGSLEFIYIPEKPPINGEGQRVTFNCTNLGTQCIFGTALAGVTIGNLKGGATAKAVIEAEVNHVNGTNDEGTFLCGSSAYWEATYEITSPKPLHAVAS